MLARENKIKTLKKQREFIKKQLSNADKGDGDTSCVYVGYVYPEVINYFKNEGYEVEKVELDKVGKLTVWRPIYIFYIGDDIKLTEEEMKQAEKYEPDKKEDDENLDRYDEIVKELFRECRPRR